MIRFLLLLVWLVTSFSWTASAQATCTPAAGEPIRLGAVFPPETLFSAGAADAYRGAAAMVEAFNNCGGVNGRPIELVYAPAANFNQVIEAVDRLGDVPLIIGSGSSAVSAALVELSQGGTFVYWEVSEPLDYYHQWSFSPRLNSYDLGLFTAEFIQNIIAASILDGGTVAAALVYDDRPRARMTADGLRTGLDNVQEYTYTAPLSSAYNLGVELREAAVNTVIVVGADNDADRLWRAMRQANANVQAWIQIGGSSYRRATCSRLGNTDGLITISTTGSASRDYYRNQIGALYDIYRAAYGARFQQSPGEQVDQAASGLYLLLRGVLPQTETFTSEGIQQAIVAADIPAPAGLLGEGLAFPFGAGTNTRAGSLIWQRQNGRFCTIYPDALATCDQPLQPFPTWRDRAKLEAETACQDEPLSPAPRPTALPKL